MDSFKSMLFIKNKIPKLLIIFIFFSLAESANDNSNRLYPKMIDLPDNKFLSVIID